MDEIDTHITETGAPSRRQALNAMYMFEGVHLLSVAAVYYESFHCRLEERQHFQRGGKAIRAIRPPLKKYCKDPDDETLKYRVGNSIMELQKSGGSL